MWKGKIRLWMMCEEVKEDGSTGGAEIAFEGRGGRVDRDFN